MCSFLLHVVYSIGFISRFYCVVFFYSLCLCVCVCVWVTLPDLNKMDGMEFLSLFPKYPTLKCG